jgi:hypothetical protein
MGKTPTALERHAGFFDPKGTGFVTMAQTREGMERLGVTWIWRMVLPPIINGFLGYLTEGRPSTVIRVDRIAQGKHPFDSGTFDAKGEADPAAFDALFAGGDLLTAEEMKAVVSSRGNHLPEMGRVAGALGHWFSSREIELFFCVAADSSKMVGGREVPAVSKKTLRAFYDGTLLPELARRRILVEAGCVKRRTVPRAQ